MGDHFTGATLKNLKLVCKFEFGWVLVENYSTGMCRFTQFSTRSIRSWDHHQLLYIIQSCSWSNSWRQVLIYQGRPLKGTEGKLMKQSDSWTWVYEEHQSELFFRTKK